MVVSGEEGKISLVREGRIIRDLDANLSFLVIPKGYARIILRRGSRISAHQGTTYGLTTR